MRTDHELLAHYIERNDRAALNELFGRHYGAVYTTVLKLVHEEADARDLTQETFLAALRGAAGYQPLASFRSWLLKIAVNEVRQHWRNPRRRPADGNFAALMSDLQTESAAQSASRREFERAMEDALVGFPDDLKIPLVLHYYDDLPLSEIGGILEAPKSSVQRRLEKAVELLKKRFRAGGHAAFVPLIGEYIPTVGLAPATTAGASGLASGLAKFAGGLLVKGKIHVAVAILLVTIVAGAFWQWTRTRHDDADPIAGGTPRSTTTAPEDGVAKTGTNVSPRPDRSPEIHSEGPGSITGCVLSIEGYAPIEGARIEITPREGGFTNVHYSDTKGRFDASSLPTGTHYELLVTREGFGYLQVPGVRIVSPARQADVKVLLLAPSRPLSGIVVTPSGEGLPGVSVVAGQFRFDTDPMPGVLSGRIGGLETLTDSGGRFVLKGLGVGYHRLRAEKKGYAAREWSEFLVPPDGPDPELRLELVPGGVVAGRVVDRDGKPLPGATVELSSTETWMSRGMGYVRAGDRGSVLTDAAGGFSFDMLPLAPYVTFMIDVSMEGYLGYDRDFIPLNTTDLSIILEPAASAGKCTLKGVLLDAGTRQPIHRRATITIQNPRLGAPIEREADASGRFEFSNLPADGYQVLVRPADYQGKSITVTLQDGETMLPVELTRGSIVWGTVKDAVTGRPIPRATVSSRTGPIEAAETGDYELGGYMADTVCYSDALSAEAPGYVKRTYDVMLPSGATRVRMDLELTPLAGQIRVHGKVVDADDQTVPGASVSLEVNRHPHGITWIGTRSGAAGEFEFAPIAPDMLYSEQASFRVAHPRHPPQSIRLPKEDLRNGFLLRLIAGSATAGTVLDIEGKPVAGARVGAYDEAHDFRGGYGSKDPIAAVQADAEGRFHFPALERRRLQFIPVLAGYALIAENYPAGYLSAADEARPLTLRMRRAPAITGFVRTVQGAAAQGLYLTAMSGHADNWQHYDVEGPDASGFFTVSNIQWPEPVTIEVSGSGAWQGEVTAQPGAEQVILTVTPREPGGGEGR